MFHPLHVAAHGLAKKQRGGGLDMKWGLIGASTIAAEHMIPAFRAHGDEIVWVASGNADHAHRYATTHNIGQSFGTLEAALAAGGVDAVYISSTNEKHAPQAHAAIDAGLHVLCEKPLSMSIAEASGMVAAARQAGVVFATNHHLRCSGSHRAIRDLIVAGTLGRLLSVRVHHAVYLPPHLQGWRINDASAGGGVIPDITVHDADTVRFLLGEDPVAVVAQAGVSGMGQGVEDSVMSVWTMPSGVMVSSHESFTHPFAGSGLQVHGSKGSVFARDIMTQQPIGEIELVTESGRQSVPFSKHNLYVEGVRMFRDAVAGRGRPAATGEDGIKSLEVAFAVREAARQGQRIAVEYGV